MDDTKICVQCGRPMRWRKRWARAWDHIKYCSEACRRMPRNGFEQAILKLLATRAASATICPSEVLNPADRQNPGKMERVRQAARRLVHKGLIEITQGGVPVDPGEFKGPIRLRRRQSL